MSDPVRVRASAKINLHLGVGAPREDGFHPLVTVFHAIGLYDDLTVTRADEPGSRIEVTVPSWMDEAAVPTGGENIIARAAQLLAGSGSESGSGWRFTLDKEIPVAGGMAGGSADAAAALIAIDRLADLDSTDDELLALAAQLGSDVPFSLVGGTVLGRGRGEILTPIPDSGTWWWVAVPQRAGLSTPSVYRRYDELFPDAPAEPDSPHALLSALASGDAHHLAGCLHNDLEAAAIDLRPELGTLIARGEALGALRGMVSGSGPTVVFCCTDGASARELADALRRDGQEVALVANGPVAGAHVLR